ncbi:MAG: CRISPR-associated helicase/endonuclease Cas3 [Deltaproteobacteria bacterium HGW-Deltaproteobacteria-15]|nr:MAG: CRISPR-associated helicase/endonuclease Cas3 [Deltaproteobacteria bacterium HGW-Deltaproteobacteria-15]
MQDEFWARPGQSLVSHLDNVAKLASDFARDIGLPNAGFLLGSLHDQGKASQAFQNYIRSATGFWDQEDEHYVDAAGKRGKIDHSTAGSQKIWAALKGIPLKKTDPLFAQMLALCLCSHHSGLIDCLEPGGENAYKRRIGKDTGKTHLTEAVAAWGKECGPSRHDLLLECLKEMRGRFSKLLKTSPSNLCSSCITRSCSGYVPNPIAWFHLGFYTRMLLSCLLDADRIDSADSGQPLNALWRSSGETDWEKPIRRLETHLLDIQGDRPIDEIRRSVSQRCLDRAEGPKCIYKLTVPTGGGKTLSGLRFALHHARRHRMKRIINVIPYTSIIDQNADVARSILEPKSEEEFGSIVLEHHSNLEPEKETPRSRLAAECWDAPVIYTTMVQFMESLFSHGTRSARRMHRLAQAVIVFDEIQTLPVKCARLFCNAVNFLVRECGASVVLCTATQPLLDKLEQPERGVLTLEANSELMPDVENLFHQLERVEILDRTRVGGWTLEQVADLAAEQYEKAGSCLAVVNTKDWARRLYNELSCRGLPGVHHLSTDMCAAHRLCVLNEMRSKLENHEPVLCVSTQLIEAGVDISFGAAIRFLASLDSILQTAGRCNRNRERRNGPGLVHILNPDREELGPLKEIKTGQEAARRLLQEFHADPESLGGSLTHPKVIERYFLYHFFDRREEMDYTVKANKVGRTDNLVNMLSCNPKNPGNMDFHPSLRQSFAEAGRHFQVIDEATRAVIVPFGEGKDIIAELCGLHDPKMLGPLLRRAQRYSVNLFPGPSKVLDQAGAIHEIQKGWGIYYLDKRHYSDRTGVSTTVVNDMDVHIC